MISSIFGAQIREFSLQTFDFHFLDKIRIGLDPPAR